MIKLFRKIRYNLMSENKTGRYFKYAIGEIILVVIGILIALQINNWNENRKLKQNEVVLVKQLLNDVKKDSIFFEDRLFKLNNQIQFYNDIFNMCNNRPIISQFKDSISVAYQPFVRLDRQSSLIKNNPEAYNNLINEDLKLELQNHIAQYEFAKVTLDFYSAQIKQYITPLRIKHYPLMPNYASAKSVEDFSFMCDNNEILGVIELMKQNAKSSILNVKRFVASNLKLSKALRQYLNNSND